MKLIERLYSLLIGGANSLQSLFLLFVRLYWGWQFAVDGWGKLHNLARVTEYFGSLGLPAPGMTALGVSILELVGGILLALGLGTRLIALLLTGNMTVAYITGDREALMSFFSDPDKFIAAAPFSYWMASLIILFFGPGAYSLDALIARMRNSGTSDSPMPDWRPGRRGLWGNRANLKSRILLAFLVLGSAAVLGIFVSRPVSAISTQTVSTCGSTIDIRFDNDSKSVSNDALMNWIRRAATAVCTYYGKFPVPQLKLRVHVRGSDGVHQGVTYPSDNGGLVRISVGAATTPAELDNDWMLTHEMIHLAFPSMAENRHWIEEGISTYVEPIARVQAGQLSAEKMWSDVARDMPQGEPEAGDRGLDRTDTWGRTYWGGAMFCLLADVRIREQTHNRKGLQDALRGILNSGGNITDDWEIERAFAVGDKATGTTVLTDLYREMRDKPAPVDLNQLWQKLGIKRQPDGTVEFINSAPLASVREAITRPLK